VNADGDTEWIQHRIGASRRKPNEPGAGSGHALRRLLSSGARPQDIAELVRVMQWETLVTVIDLIDGIPLVTYPSEEVARVEWALFRVDEDGAPVGRIAALHESILETDPAKREMRPVRTDP
jgi:hypothetical protein